MGMTRRQFVGTAVLAGAVTAVGAMRREREEGQNCPPKDAPKTTQK